MMILREFLRQLQTTFSPVQHARVRDREAERLEIAPAHWSMLRAMNLDLRMVREAHRSASKLTSVRRADREGAWDLVSARPGKLRSHPQSFRAGAHVEPAWDHTTLKHRVAELVNSTRDGAASDPLRALTGFFRAFVRAQPFLGQNERVALIVASALLRSLDLPALAVGTERLPKFVSALVAADDSALTRFLDVTLWSEALALVEWLSPVATARGTLAEEHAALVAARTPVELAPFVDQLTTILEPMLRPTAAARYVEHSTFADRARAAVAAAYRGHPICPQHVICETRWAMSDESEAVLIVALPGRGTTSAVSAQLSFEHPRVVATTSSAILLPTDEPPPSRVERVRRWLSEAVCDSPRRGYGCGQIAES